MATHLDSGTSRRQFLAWTGVVTASALLAPRNLFALTDAVSTPGLVEKARKEAANATVTVQRLRGNVSVLMGAGGNIAVLPGRDGKLLIDAGFAGARPKIADALAGISSDQSDTSSIRTGTSTTPTGMNGYTRLAQRSLHKRTRASISRETHELKAGISRFALRPQVQSRVMSSQPTARLT